MVELRATTSFPFLTVEAILNCEIILGVASLGLLIGAKYRTDTCQTTMSDSTTSKLNLSTESIQVAAEDAREAQITKQAAAEDAREAQITNQAAAEDAREAQITNQAAAEDAREAQITNQAAAEDGSTFMDPILYVAAADGDIHVLEQYGIHVQLTPKKNTILHVAAQFGQADCVNWILQLPSPSSLLQMPNEKGDTPLHLAAREGHLTVVKNLIDAAKQLQEGDTERGGTIVCKAMLRMTNEDNDTALHEAVRYHHPEVVKLLIQEDPEFPYGANAEGNTPLYIATDWGFGDLVQMILDNCSSPAHSGINGRTALHASVILNHQAMTKKILEWKPALTKELDKNGWSPLHFAAYVGCHPKIVAQLLEKSDRYVAYLGVKDHGNRTALHIAASRGHVDIVKLLVSRFPDCCEKVDDKGNNVLHLIMPKNGIFATSGLSNIRWLRVRGLLNEKNVEGKTPLYLFRMSIISETMLTWILDTLVRLFQRLCQRVSRPSSSLKIKEDSDSSNSSDSSDSSNSRNSSESKERNEMKKTMKSHMLVATLIATVTFAAGFTLPGGYIQNESNDQGMAVLSLPTNGTKGKDQYMASAVRENFILFVMADSTAMVLSMCAIGIYILAAVPTNHKNTLVAFLYYGYMLTMVAMLLMVCAFVGGLQAVLYSSELFVGITTFSLYVFLLFLAPCLLKFLRVPWFFLYHRLQRSQT